MAHFTQFFPGDISEVDLSFYGAGFASIYQDLRIKSPLASGVLDIVSIGRDNYSLDFLGKGFPTTLRGDLTGRVTAATEYVWDGEDTTTLFELKGIDVPLEKAVRVIVSPNLRDDRALIASILSDDDVIRLSAGDDVMRGFGGDDRITGGRGDDTLYGDGGADRISGGLGADLVIGGAGADRLAGGGQSDRLAGGGGADKLTSGAGDDALRGQGGADTLIGGRGADLMAGGLGADTFVFTRAGSARANTDVVLDFRAGVDTLAFRTGDTLRSLRFVTEEGTDSVTVEHKGGTVELVGISFDDLTRDSFDF